MSYDLALRRQTVRNHARGESVAVLHPTSVDKQAVGMIVLLGLGLTGAIAWSLPRVRRAHDRYHYRQMFRNDPHITQEIPAITMSEMVFQEDPETR